MQKQALKDQQAEFVNLCRAMVPNEQEHNDLLKEEKNHLLKE